MLAPLSSKHEEFKNICVISVLPRKQRYGYLYALHYRSILSMFFLRFLPCPDHTKNMEGNLPNTEADGSSPSMLCLITDHSSTSLST